MSVARSHHAVAVVDGKIYAIGGWDAADGQYLDSVETYDPQTDSWQQVASMPHARHSHAAAAMGGKIYVSGGDSPGDGGEHHETVSTLMVFDPQADTWTQLEDMDKCRADHASAAIGGKLYVFGGYAQVLGGSGRRASVEAYDPISNTWAQVSDLSVARDEFMAVAL